MSIPEFQDGARKLSEKERAELAWWLLESLPPADQEDGLSDSLEEAERRRADPEGGRASLVRENEFWAAVRDEREKWR